MRPARSRAARAPLPVPVLLLALVGAGALVLPFIGLGTRVAWTELPGLISSDSALTALELSLRTCLIATLISAALGVPLALLLARQWPGVRAARVLAVLPMTMPPVVAGIALLSTFGRRGLLGHALEAAGLRVSFSTLAVVIAQVFVSMPYLVVTLEAALRSRDTHLETVAQTLGAGRWRVLSRITLPLAAPALVRGTALALGRSLGEFGATIAFAGSKEGVTRTMPLAIYLERENDTATSLALAVVLIALSFLVVGATNVPWTAAVRRTGRPGPSARRDRAGHGAEPEEQRSPNGDGRAEGPPAEPAEGRGQGRPRESAALTVAFSSSSRAVAVELTVPAGRTLAVVGPNGSGKSTVCAVAAGLVDAEAGRVLLGEEVLDGPGAFVPAGRREVALLSQSPGVFPHMSVLDNVAFGPRSRGEPRRAARELALRELAAVGAGHLAGRSGSDLSGGQAARVALARALATRPRVLILDEPMAAVDVSSRARMRALLAHRSRQEGLTVLLVTHDVLDVAALADDVVVLEEGRVVESGPARRVLSRPVSSFAAQLTGMSVLSGMMLGTPGAPRLRLPTGTVLTGRPLEALAGPAPGTPLSGPGTALVPPEAVALYPAGGPAPAGSPRNMFSGRIIAVERSGALVSLRLDIGAGQALSAVLTPAALGELAAGPGQELMCVVKAVQVRLQPRSNAPASEKVESS